MTTKTETNGHARKTLASQLDRLDGILDALGAGLNQAVAGAVQVAVEAAVRQAVEQAVKDAVQAVLTEVLTNPDLHALFRGVAAPDQTASPTEPAVRTAVMALGTVSRVTGGLRPRVVIPRPSGCAACPRCAGSDRPAARSRR